MITGAAVAVIQDNTVLLTKREDFEVWCLPGGMIDEDESFAECARREVREETGLEVELTRLVGVYSQLGRSADHDVLFAARLVGGTLRLDPGEVLEARFFPFDALPDPMISGHRDFVQDAIRAASGIVKTHLVSFADDLPEERAYLYRMRDQSGLARHEFYLRKFPEPKPEQIKIEVKGCAD